MLRIPLRSFAALAALACLSWSVRCGFTGELPPAKSIRGAVYVPAEAYNAPQLWKDFSLLVVQKYPIGNFFWSLMIKRAYLPPQRNKGTINGLFWPDGTVWSLADARAIAMDPSLALREKKALPSGFLDYLRGSK